MDAALGLGLRHALHPVHTALVLEAVVGPGTIHREDGFLHAAKLGLVQVEHFQLPSPALHIHGVHAQQTVGKQGRFLAACAAADLHNDIFAIVHIFGQQHNFEIIFQFFHILTFFADFLLYHLFKVRVKSTRLFQQGFCLFQMILCSLPLPVGLHNRLCVVILPHQLAEQRRVGSGIRLVQADGKLLKAMADSIHLGKHVRHNSGSSPNNSNLHLQRSRTPRQGTSQTRTCKGIRFPCELCRTLDLPGLYHLFDVLFNFSTRQHHLMPAASAPDLEIHADAQHFKALRTAGVLFAGEDGIAYSNVHNLGFSLLPAFFSRLWAGGACARPRCAGHSAYKYSIMQSRIKCKYPQ